MWKVPPHTHTTPTPPSAHTLTTLSHVQVGANLGLMVTDLKTITRGFFFHRRGEHLAECMRLWLSSIVWLLGLIHCYGRLSRGPKWFAPAATPFASFPLALGELWSPKYESAVGHSVVSGHWVLCFGNHQSCCWDQFSCCVWVLLGIMFWVKERERAVCFPLETKGIVLLSGCHFCRRNR